MPSINAKEFTIARVNPARATAPAAPDNTIPGDWEFLCGAESHTVTINNPVNERRKLTDCQDRTSDVIDELKRVGRTLSGSMSGVIENTPAGRWLIELATAGEALIEDARIYLPGILYIRTNLYISDFSITGQDLDNNVSFSANIRSTGALVTTIIAAP